MTPGAQPTATPTKRRLILLADDDLVLQRSVRRESEAAGYDLLTAATGLAVLGMAASSQPDLIILDIRFPDADGRDLLKTLKLDPRTEHIPVLVWSASDYDSDRRIALELGAEDYLEKGRSTALLPKVARVLLRLKQQASESASAAGAS